MTERLAGKTAEFFCRKGWIKEREIVIYRYLVQVWLEKALAVFTVVAVAGYLHMMLEVLLFFAIFIPIRNYAGGLHFETYLACYIGSVLTFTSVLVLTKYWSRFCPAGVSLCIGALCLWGIWLLAPVESPNRPLEEKERVLFAKRLKNVLLFWFAVQLVLWILNWKRYLFLTMVTEIQLVATMQLGKWKYA